MTTKYTHDLRPGDVIDAPIEFGTRRTWRQVADVTLVSGEHEISFTLGEPMLAEPEEVWNVRPVFEAMARIAEVMTTVEGKRFDDPALATAYLQIAAIVHGGDR